MSLRYLLLAALVLAPSAALSQPDLAVRVFRIEPNMVPIGEPLLLGYRICNLGSEPAPASLVGFFLSEDESYDGFDDRFLSDDSAPALDPLSCTSQGLTLEIPLDVTPGLYTLFAVADYDGVLQEPNEENNVRSRPLVVEGIPETPIAISLVPEDPPVVIPAAGGSFTFEVSVSNLSTEPQTFSVWAEALLPNGTVYGPLYGPVQLTLAPGEGRGPVTLQQVVPGSVPPGLYRFRVNAGDFPNNPTTAESFGVEKLGDPGRTAPSATAGGAEWTVEQVSGPPLAGSSDRQPEADAATVFPNPAGDAATLTFHLAAGASVRLHVLDLRGRAVVSLPPQALEAGAHALRLDVSALPAGTYLYRLEADGRTATTGRLTVVR